eukprot:485520-Rhodomonas_salina.1
MPVRALVPKWRKSPISTARGTRDRTGRRIRTEAAISLRYNTHALRQYQAARRRVRQTARSRYPTARSRYPTARSRYPTPVLERV